MARLRYENLVEDDYRPRDQLGVQKKRDRFCMMLLLVAAVSCGASLLIFLPRRGTSTASDSPPVIPPWTPDPSDPIDGWEFSPNSTLSSTASRVVVLGSGESISSDRREVLSPNQKFAFLFRSSEPIVLYRDRSIVWKSDGSGSKLAQQEDGNLVLRRSNGKASWTTKTNGNRGAVLVLNDVGQLAVVSMDGIVLWLGGVPQGQQTKSYKDNLRFPVRGVFYYPWYPETWTVQGHPVRQNPTLGKYRSDSALVLGSHIKALEYAHTDLVIASWWGADEHLDRARITNLISQPTSLKWTVYFEQRRHIRETVSELRTKLAYLAKWFTWHPRWGRIDGRPVVFVYNAGGNCTDTETWMTAAQGQWYVVMKLFQGYENCPVQPDSWHEYGPAKAITRHKEHSFSISPGFWIANSDTARLERLSGAQWRQSVRQMIQSGTKWHLITTFNEWGEGTAVEAAKEWDSSSGYGRYLDILHHELPI